MSGNAHAPQLRRDLLDIVDEYWFDKERGPTRTELAERLGVSKSAINQHITALVKAGKLDPPTGERHDLRTTGV